MQDLRGETLIYDLTADKAFCLNETSAFVWQNCDGEKEVGQIAEGLARKNRQPVNEDIVWLAIEQLRADNLMSEAEISAEIFAGMNRREIIKKVGLATMIALPLISGLVAPTAAHAQSGSSVACRSNADCTTGCCASGRCVAARSVPDGEACSADCQCRSDLCNGGTCELNG